MFLSITIFWTLLCAVWGDDNRAVINIPLEHIKIMQEYGKMCATHHGLDPNTARKMLDWSLPNDEVHKKFLHCVCLNAGYIIRDGHFELDRMLEFNVVNGSQEDYKKGLEECNKVTKDNYLETTYEMGACLHSKFRLTTAKPAS